ncbi:MAG: hypothetical protein Q7R79_00595 [bacterium]|nr:hypothetical protein [bacterium]
MGLIDDLRRRHLQKSSDQPVLTEETAEFWRWLKPGQMVIVNDLQALMDANKLASPATSMDYEIKSSINVPIEKIGGEYWLYEVEGGGETLLLVVKMARQTFDVRMYFQVQELPTGNRLELARDQGCDWLFLPPVDSVDLQDRRNLQDFPPNQWRYTGDIQAPITDKSGTRTVTFLKKDPGELGGECSFDPPDQGLEGKQLFGTAVEYRTEEQTLNPELLILEIGLPESEEGGLIKIYLGAPVRLSEIEVLRTQ